MESHSNYEIPTTNWRKPRRKYKPPEPITSYGLIVFTPCYINKIQTYKVLIYHRRDTFEYIDFLRGGWYANNQLHQLFSAMSMDERKNIREYTFPELWDDLWVEHDCKIYKDGYIKAKKKYDAVRSLIPSILDETVSDIISPPWGFPKGKRNNIRENPIDCAIREFKEETHIQINKNHLITETPYIENFIGGNSKSYRTYYYTAMLPKEVLPEKIPTPQCIRSSTVSEEAAELKWISIDKANTFINERRKKILDIIIKDIFTNFRFPPGL